MKTIAAQDMDPHALTIVALGGNALLSHGQKGTNEEQFENALRSGQNLLPLLSEPRPLIVTHGNGPQVGNLLVRQDKPMDVLPAMPLHRLVAATQGSIGYTLQQSLQAVLRRANVRRPVLTVVTQVVVDGNDPGFQKPTKPVGPYYTAEQMRGLTTEYGWIMVESPGRGWRRAVASPLPREIIEIRQIRELAMQGYVVICVGGGGIPVVRQPDGTWIGVEAVIDKDRASALLARELSASRFIVLTEVPEIYLDFAKKEQRPLRRASVGEMRTWMEQKQFGVGSMLPKVEAALDFIEHGGDEALITDDLHLAQAMKDGSAGTFIVRDALMRRGAETRA